MRLCYSLAVLVAATILLGCGGRSTQTAPISSSASTEELGAVLAHKDDARAYMLMPHKLKAIDILSARGEEAFPLLMRTARDSEEIDSVRFAAIEAIGRFQQVSENQIPKLLEIRRGENGILVNEVLERSCKAASAVRVVPLLVDYVKDDTIEYENRQFVAAILLDIDEPAAEAAGVVKKINEYLPNTKFMPDIKPVRN
jgi:hypothetical protein